MYVISALVYYYGRIIPLNLPKDIRKKIYHDNFIRLHGKARTVNKAICAQKAAMLAEAFEHRLLELKTHGDTALEVENMKTAYEYFSKG